MIDHVKNILAIIQSYKDNKLYGGLDIRFEGGKIVSVKEWKLHIHK